MVFSDFFNFIFAPLLKLPTLAAIIIISFLISLLIIVITKYMTDQALMKRLKEEIKEYQKQAKELRSEPAKAMEVQKKAMEANMKYMTHSFKPTIITFIPIILIFGWMSSTFAYESIKPGQEFSVTAFFDKNTQEQAELIVPEGLNLLDNKTKGIDKKIEKHLFGSEEIYQANWTLKGNEGEYLLEFTYENKTQQTSVLITNGKKYINPLKKTDGPIKSIKINYKKLIVFPIGYKDWFGWLGAYIWSSIAFTMLLRKIMKVY